MSDLETESPAPSSSEDAAPGGPADGWSQPLTSAVPEAHSAPGTLPPGTRPPPLWEARRLRVGVKGNPLTPNIPARGRPPAYPGPTQLPGRGRSAAAAVGCDRRFTYSHRDSSGCPECTGLPSGSCERPSHHQAGGWILGTTRDLAANELGRQGEYAPPRVAGRCSCGNARFGEREDLKRAMVDLVLKILAPVVAAGDRESGGIARTATGCLPNPPDILHQPAHRKLLARVAMVRGVRAETAMLDELMKAKAALSASSTAQ